MLPHLHAHGMRLAACWRCHAVLSTYLSFVALLTREQEPHLTKAILESVILAGSLIRRTNQEAVLLSIEHRPWTRSMLVM